MLYVKKLCILKQLAAGFAADGKRVSALLTAEKSGARLTLSLALIGFAPLSSGRYRFLLCDEHGTAETFDVASHTGCTVKRESALDIADGFCCLVCFVGTNVTPAAFGKCGDKTYDVKRLCARLAEEEKPKPETTEREHESSVCTEKTEKGRKTESTEKNAPSAIPYEEQTDASSAIPYDDELVATENYFAFAEENDADEYHGKNSGSRIDERKKTRNFEEERNELEQRNEKLSVCGTERNGIREAAHAETEGTSGSNAAQNADAESVLGITGTENERTNARPCYYDSVKEHLERLLAAYPPEDELEQIVPYSRWVKITFARGKYYTVGLISDETAPRYVCYGVPAEKHGEPPNALRGYCSFMPLSVFDLEGRGYWMMFQDAETGKCVRIP